MGLSLWLDNSRIVLSPSECVAVVDGIHSFQAGQAVAFWLSGSRLPNRKYVRPFFAFRHGGKNFRVSKDRIGDLLQACEAAIADGIPTFSLGVQNDPEYIRMAELKADIDDFYATEAN